MHLNFKKHVVLIFFMLFSPLLFARVVPVATEIQLGGKEKKNYRLRIINSSDEVAYVKINNLVKVMQPATLEQKEVLVDNIKKQEIIVTPQLLIIQPQSDMDVSVVDMNNNRDIEEAFYFTMQEVNKPAEKGLNVTFAYRILVRAVPTSMNQKLEIKRLRDNIQLTNLGNIRFSFEDAKLCKGSSSSMCIQLENNNFRLYPGFKTVLPKKEGYELHLKEVFPEHKNHIIPYND
ncbi:hypothetical protein ACET5Y_07975 [Aeromonas veronii]